MGTACLTLDADEKTEAPEGGFWRRHWLSVIAGTVVIGAAVAAVAGIMAMNARTRAAVAARNATDVVMVRIQIPPLDLPGAPEAKGGMKKTNPEIRRTKE